MWLCGADCYCTWVGANQLVWCCMMYSSLSGHCYAWFVVWYPDKLANQALPFIDILYNFTDAMYTVHNLIELQRYGCTSSDKVLLQLSNQFISEYMEFPHLCRWTLSIWVISWMHHYNILRFSIVALVLSRKPEGGDTD